MRVVQRFGGFIGESVTLRCQIDRGRDHLAPFLTSIFRLRQFEAPDAARDSHGAPAVDGIPRRITLRIKVHVARGLFGSALAKVDKSGPAIGEAHQHESAAAQVAGERMRNRERKTHSYRGVHGIAAVLQHRDTYVRRKGFVSDYHPVPRADRLMSA